MHTAKRMATPFIRSLVAFVGIAVVPMQLPAAAAAPVHLTSEQDHNRILTLLHITALRRGPDGDPTSPRAANFDESKVDPNLRLPDPLLMRNGKQVTTAGAWWKHRRPEIVAAFDTEMYGRVPSNVPAVFWKVSSTVHEQAGEVPVNRKEVSGHVDNSAYPAIEVNIQLKVEGGWVDAKGMFLGAVHAGPVYRLLGKKDLGTTEFPPMETALIDGDIAFRQHSGGHTTGPNWPTFLTFASRYIQVQN